MTIAPVTVGVDVGATKTAAVAWCRGQLSEILVEPTTLGDADSVAGHVVRLVEALGKSLGTIDGVGLSIAGVTAYDTGVVVASNLPLAGVPLRSVLSDVLQKPVVLDNDGNCAAIAEAHRCTSDMSRYLVMLTLGTGVGGGALIDGELLRGRNGIGVRLGHLVVSADGPDCFGICPNQGCLEALCSGTALARDGRESALRFPGSSLGEVLAQTGCVRAEDVVECARACDRHAQIVMRRFARWLGVGLSSLVNIFEPRLIAIGGGLSTAGDLFLSAAIEEMTRRVAPVRREQVAIQLARSGPHASVLGAALLAAKELTRGPVRPHSARSDALGPTR